MSSVRRQAFVDAPVPVVWDLVSDVNRHPEWWPRVLEVECEGLEPGCTYREVIQTPFGKDEMAMRVEGLEDFKELKIRCVNSGTFVQFLLTEARGGTFVDTRMGMEPRDLGSRLFDAVAGKRYFRNWLEHSLEAMRTAAEQRWAILDSNQGPPPYQSGALTD
jgi:uncharacterized protein YndB with AHSA1/START domain